MTPGEDRRIPKCEKSYFLERRQREVPRIPLLSTWVNKGEKKGRSLSASALNYRLMGTSLASSRMVEVALRLPSCPYSPSASIGVHKGRIPCPGVAPGHRLELLI